MSKEITVVKFGSEVVCGDSGLEQETINTYADGLADSYGTDGLLIVTSGAVSAGESEVRSTRYSELDDFEEPTLAQIGNIVVMNAWREAFKRHNVTVGEILTTHREIDDPIEGHLLAETLVAGLDRKIVGVINNNDAVARDELDSFHKGKDNDRLAMHIARAVGASTLGLFTSGGGVFDDNGNLIHEISEKNYNQVIEMLLVRKIEGNDKSKRGKGGIVSKVETGWEAARAGMQASIAAPNEDMTGESATRFVW